MRKILSVIMVVAMLVTSILPAIANVAAADADALVINMSSVGFVENDDGTVSAKVDLEFTNNPGFVDLSVMVYYNNTEVGEGTDEAAADFADYAAINAGKRSTLAAVKKLFTAAGVATGANIMGKQIDINCYDPETGDPVLNTATGTAVTLEFTAEEFSADMLATIGVFVIDEIAYDADGNEVATEVVTPTLAVGAKPENPYATTYDVESFPADEFTINLTGTHVYENGFVEGEIPTADVKVELFNNTPENNEFGIWGFRCFVTYPEELTAIAYTNGELFADTEMQAFGDCATNVNIAEELAKIDDGDEATDAHQIVYAALNGFEYVDYTTYATDGIKMSVIQYLMTNWYDLMTTEQGHVQTITFQLPEDAKAGDRWDIKICGAWDDVSDNGESTPDDQHPDILPTVVPTQYNDGYIEIISVKEESFDEGFTFHMDDLTISPASNTATLKMYVSGNDVNPYGFWAARLFLFYDPAIKVVGIDQGKIVPTGGFTLGDFNIDLDQLAIDEPKNLIVTAAPLAFEEKGFDYKNTDYRLTCFYFQAPSDADCITKDGHYATITFELPEGAQVGDSWTIGVASSHENADVIGYFNDPAESSTVAEIVNHSLDDGSITIAGEAVVTPDPEPDVHVHELEYTAGVEAGCHYIGNTEFWYCAGCDTVFADEAATIVTNRKNVIIPATGSDLLVHMDAVEAGCHYNGNIEYWVCYECEQVWADEALTQLTNIKNVIIPAVGSENLQHFEAVAPAPGQNGNVEYWFCPDCEQVWVDAALTQLSNLKNVIIPALEVATVTVGSDEVLAGEDAVIAVEIANNTGLFISKYIITYDSAVLTLKDIANGDVFADEDVIFNTNVEGQIIVYFENADEIADVVADGTLVNITFATAEDAVSGDYAIEIVAEEGNNINAAGDNVTIDAVNGVVSIIDCIHANVTPVVSVPATVYAEGVMEFVCDDCGEVAYTEAIAKLAGIEVGEWVMGTAGEEIAVDVNLLNNSGVWALSATFAFDANVLEFVRVDSGLFAADEYSFSVKDGVVTVYVESADLENIVDDGAAFTLVFKALSCGYSDIEATLVADNTINNAGENVAFETINGSVLASCALTHVEAVEATCHTNGMQEYWYCEFCDAVYADAQGRWLTNRRNLVIPMTAEIIYVEAIEPGCHYIGNIEYWYCSECDAVYADAALTQLTNRKNVIVPELGGDVVYVAAKAPTVYENGNVEYWYCETCEQVWADEARTQLTNRKNVIIPMIAGLEVSEWVMGAAGDEIAVAVNLLNNPGVWSLSATFAYDANVLEFVRVDSALFAADEFSFSVENGVVTVYVESADLENIADDGAAFTLVFKALSCGYSDIEATLVEENTIDNNGDAVAFETINGSVLASCALTHVEAVEASCHQTGMQEYWYCEFCDSVYADAQGRWLTNRKNLVIPATAEIIYVEAVEPSCCQTGSAAYYYCSECDAVFDEDFVLTNRKNLTIPATAEIIYVEAVEPSCCQNGSAAYYYCSECDAVYDEDYRLTNRKNLTIPATAEIIYVEAVEPSCCQNGSAAYYYCSECDAVYDEDFRLTNRKNLTIPATAEIIYVEAVEPSCCQNGSAAYYYCSECDAVYDEDFRLTNRKNLTIPATAEIIYVEAVEAICHQNGSAAYYYCSECDAVYDEDFRLTNRKNLTIPAPVELTYVPAADATCTENGNVEYWYCAECEAVFADAAGIIITNFKNVVIPAVGHTAGDKVTTIEPTLTTEGAWEIRCTVCGELLESGTISALAFITKASATQYISSISLDDTVITIAARPGAAYVKFAVGYNAGIKIASANATQIASTYAYLVVNYGDNEATIVATDANGNSVEYTVVIEWTDLFYSSYVGGYTVEGITENDGIFNIDVEPNMNNASIGFVLYNGTTYEASEGLQVVLSGGKVYFKALESAENDTYTVTFTAANGATKTITLNFVFDYANVTGVAGGSMVDGIELAAGNVINITVSDEYAYASFRYVLKATGATIDCDDANVDRVVVNNINWFKIYNDGTGFVTTEMTVTSASGIVETYTVNVTFGSNN